MGARNEGFTRAAQMSFLEQSLDHSANALNSPPGTYLRATRSVDYGAAGRHLDLLVKGGMSIGKPTRMNRRAKDCERCSL